MSAAVIGILAMEAAWLAWFAWRAVSVLNDKRGGR